MPSAAIWIDDSLPPVAVRRDRRARRLKLRVHPVPPQLRLTVPAGTPPAMIHRFLHRHRGWAQRQIDRLPAATPFAEGALIPLRGIPHRLCRTGRVRGRRRRLRACRRLHPSRRSLRHRHVHRTILTLSLPGYNASGRPAAVPLPARERSRCPIVDDSARPPRLGAHAGFRERFPTTQPGPIGPRPCGSGGGRRCGWRSRP